MRPANLNQTNVECGECNVSIINVVKQAHGLSVRPARLIEPIR